MIAVDRGTLAATIRDALERADGCRGELWKDDATFSDALAALDALLADHAALAAKLVEAQGGWQAAVDDAARLTLLAGAAEARVAVLEAERDALQERLDFALAREETNLNRAVRAEADLQKLRAALRKYGLHLPACALNPYSQSFTDEEERDLCDCGLVAALAAAGSAATPGEGQQ